MIDPLLHSECLVLDRQTHTMSQVLKIKTVLVFISLTIIALFFSGCTSDTEVPPTSFTASLTPEISPTPEPTYTASPPIVVFIPPANDFLALSEPISSTLESLSAQAGWSFVSTNQLTPEILREEIKVAVFIDPTDEIRELIETNADTHFIAIGSEGFSTRDNLSLIGPNGFRFDRQVFLGGYIAALLTQDWRVGEIIDVSQQQLTTVELSFRNGLKFYCGLCQLTFPPFHNYPIFTSLEGDWNSSIEFLQTYNVNTVFLYVDDFDLDAIDSLLESGLLLIGITSPPESIRSNWVATIRHKPEEILIEKWDEITSGEGGWVVEIPLRLEDLNQSLISEGKQRLIDEILIDIQTGHVDPAVTPPAPIGE
jgi:hypothetical protein